MAGNLPNKNKPEIPQSTESGSAGKSEKKKKEGFSFSELRRHKNPIVRIFMKVVYSIWLAVMGIGIFFAWIISVLLL